MFVYILLLNLIQSFQKSLQNYNLKCFISLCISPIYIGGNNLLASNDKAIIKSSNLSEKKLRLLNTIQQIREETKLLKYFRNKTNYLAYLPKSNLFSIDQLL